MKKELNNETKKKMFFRRRNKLSAIPKKKTLTTANKWIQTKYTTLKKKNIGDGKTKIKSEWGGERKKRQTDGGRTDRQWVRKEAKKMRGKETARWRREEKKWGVKKKERERRNGGREIRGENWKSETQSSFVIHIFRFPALVSSSAIFFLFLSPPRRPLAKPDPSWCLCLF